MIRISVIMGIYNCADTLSEALDSIIQQTYTDWKVILCDDGSTDNTFDVALTYTNRFPDRFILLRNESNVGLNYTLNRCLEYADTEYVARMDGDDISLPTRFEKEVIFLDSHPEYAIVSCPMIYFDENGEWGRGKSVSIPTKESVGKETPHCHAPCMVRREAYVNVSGYTVDKRLLRMEDYHLWIKMYAHGYCGYNLEEHLYMMRDDKNAYKRRAYKYRLNEAYTHYTAVKMLRISPLYLIYALRPLVVGAMPKSIYSYFHKKRVSQS